MTNSGFQAHIVGMSVRWWMAAYLAMGLVAALGLCFDFFSYLYLIVLAIIFLGGPLLMADWKSHR
jgi:hypothetical protein